jgi:hypothetical protein
VGPLPTPTPTTPLSACQPGNSTFIKATGSETSRTLTGNIIGPAPNGDSVSQLELRLKVLKHRRHRLAASSHRRLPFELQKKEGNCNSPRAGRLWHWGSPHVSERPYWENGRIENPFSDFDVASLHGSDRTQHRSFHAPQRRPERRHRILRFPGLERAPRAPINRLYFAPAVIFPSVSAVLRRSVGAARKTDRPATAGPCSQSKPGSRDLPLQVSRFCEV